VQYSCMRTLSLWIGATSREQLGSRAGPTTYVPVSGRVAGCAACCAAAIAGSSKIRQRDRTICELTEDGDDFNI
jgi:hypothetical protein